jgi:hypothetical protein
MLTAFVILILIGIIGGDDNSRTAVISITMVIFLAGIMSFLYSKWVEQSGIREGAQVVKALLDDQINPRYADSPHRIRWTVGSWNVASIDRTFSPR